jgi:hypothetical protein
MSKLTKTAIAKYTEQTCIKAFAMHNDQGMGANTVGFYLGLTTRQADAAINAGRELSAI